MSSVLDRTILRFLVLFFVLVLGFSLFIQISWIDEAILGPYTEFLARVGAGLLSSLGTEVRQTGTIIRGDQFAVDVRRGCDGVVATILLVSACLAYPMPWRERLTGTLLGYVLVFVLNIGRIVMLTLLGLTATQATFDLFHTYVSQFAVIALTMVFWIYWAGRHKPESAPL